MTSGLPLQSAAVALNDIGVRLEAHLRQVQRVEPANRGDFCHWQRESVVRLDNVRNRDCRPPIDVAIGHTADEIAVRHLDAQLFLQLPP
jgi:hypothetical protein